MDIINKSTLADTKLESDDQQMQENYRLVIE